jgi:hypothetical protein
MGVATFPHDGTDAETLIANADTAVYKAKDAGRDSFQFFTAEMNARAHERLELQDGIRKGIARSEFYLLYLPQVDLKSGRVFAVEALIRSKHPTLGVISPIQFIPLAEETGLIVETGFCIRHAARIRNGKMQAVRPLPSASTCLRGSFRRKIGRTAFFALWKTPVLTRIPGTGADGESRHARRRAGDRNDERSSGRRDRFCHR